MLIIKASLRRAAVILRSSGVTQSMSILGETLLGQAFARPTLRYRSLIWSDQTTLASALPETRKDTVTSKND